MIECGDLRAAVACGALVGGANPQQMDDLENYAGQIGLAFQVADDILNVEGDPHLMGKATGTDAIRGKATYPDLMGLEESKQFARTLVKDALQALENFDNRSDPLRAIARYIIERTH